MTGAALREALCEAVTGRASHAGGSVSVQLSGGLDSTTEPTTVADDQVTHAAIVRIRASAYRAALYRDAMQANGVPTAMPFVDHRVVMACLAVLPWERTDPWCPKPLLHAAFRDVIPAAALRSPGRATRDTREPSRPSRAARSPRPAPRSRAIRAFAALP